MLQQQGRAVDVRAVRRIVARGTRRAALTLIGFGLIAVGLAGLLLPVLPGWVLVIAGFAVLSREYSWAHSGLAFARRHAVRSGTKLRALASRRRRRAVSTDEPSGESSSTSPASETIRRSRSSPAAATDRAPRGF
jgi:hypothetical protein